MQFDPSIIWQNLPLLLSGIWLTILLVATALVLGIVLGLVVCAGTLIGRGLVFYLSVGYVGLFRGLPETVIIFWLYYCAPLILNTRLSAFWTGTAALAIPSGAYLAEIFRAGILAVPRGQLDAGRAVGLSSLWLVWDVIAPQALRMMIPPMLGITTILMKNSALVSAIGVEELFYRANVLSGQTLRHFELLSAVAVIYFLLILPLSILVQRREKRLLAQVW
jgi:His/Glu/Gln/Arg/opine family amino acid ABC transporter permease subunit